MCFSLTFNFRLRASLPPLLFRAQNIQIYSNSLILGTYFDFVESFAYYKIFMYVKKKEGNFLSLRATRNKIFHASLRIKMKKRSERRREKNSEAIVNTQQQLKCHKSDDDDDARHSLGFRYWELGGSLWRVVEIWFANERIVFCYFVVVFYELFTLSLFYFTFTIRNT